MTSVDLSVLGDIQRGRRSSVMCELFPCYLYSGIISVSTLTGCSKHREGDLIWLSIHFLVIDVYEQCPVPVTGRIEIYLLYLPTFSIWCLTYLNINIGSKCQVLSTFLKCFSSGGRTKLISSKLIIKAAYYVVVFSLLQYEWW